MTVQGNDLQVPDYVNALRMTNALSDWRLASWQEGFWTGTAGRCETCFGWRLAHHHHHDAGKPATDRFCHTHGESLAYALIELQRAGDVLTSLLGHDVPQ